VRRQVIVVLYLFTLVAVIFSVDILFFRHHLVERLIANVGIVIIFTAFYFRFLNRK
jgi:hypothetical protein